MRKPWEFNAELAESRLELVAEMMLSIVSDTHDQLSTELDNPYTRGTTVFGRIHQSFCNLSIKSKYDWLCVTNTKLDITFTVGDVPCRFFTGDTNRPKAKVFRRNAQDCLFPKNEDDVCIWRFIIEKPAQEIDEHKIYFIGYNELQDQITEWIYEPNFNINKDDRGVKMTDIPKVDISEVEISIKKDSINKVK